MGGIVATSAERAARIRKFRTDAGACPSPMDAFLCLRGVRTLALRMERHNTNALEVARFLRDHPKVSRVHFHGLPDHPGHAAACRQMSGFGATFAFEMGGGYEAAKRLLTGEINAAVHGLLEKGATEILVFDGHGPVSYTHLTLPTILLV